MKLLVSSNRVSRGTKLPWSVGLAPKMRWPTVSELSGIFGGSSSHTVVPGCFLFLKFHHIIFLFYFIQTYIVCLVSSSLLILRDSWVNKLDSVSGALSWTVLFLFISDYFHVLTFVLSYGISLLPLSSLFSHERQKRGSSRCKGRKRETWQSGGGGT